MNCVGLHADWAKKWQMTSFLGKKALYSYHLRRKIQKYHHKKSPKMTRNILTWKLCNNSTKQFKIKSSAISGKFRQMQKCLRKKWLMKSRSLFCQNIPLLYEKKLPKMLSLFFKLLRLLTLLIPYSKAIQSYFL